MQWVLWYEQAHTRQQVKPTRFIEEAGTGQQKALTRRGNTEVQK